MITTNKPRLTKSGHDEIKTELEHLYRRDRELKERLRDEVDESRTEDGNYAFDCFEQRVVQNRIDELEHLLRGEIIDDDIGSEHAVIGSKVVLSCDGKTQHVILVDSIEANPLLGKISTDSPLGHAIQGKKAGDSVYAATPRGLHLYTLVSVN